MHLGCAVAAWQVEAPQRLDGVLVGRDHAVVRHQHAGVHALAAQFLGQAADDVAQTAGLGEGRGFSGDKEHVHKAYPSS